MKFKLEIDCDNAAFGDGMPQTIAELSLILRELSQRLKRDGHGEGSLRDYNGNSVGRYWFEGRRGDE